MNDKQEPKLYISSPKMVRNRIRHYIDHAYSIKAGDRGFVTGAFNEALRTAETSIGLRVDEKRYLVWGFALHAPDSTIGMLRTKDLSDSHFYALKKWIGPYKNESEEWHQRPAFEIEARNILTLSEWLLNKGGSRSIGSWLEDLHDITFEIERGGMASSAIVDLGGTVRMYQP